MKPSEFLAKYDTDKVNGHCYGDAYDELFSKFKREAELSILEIGIQKGGSLCAWSDYFYNAAITGIDILDSLKPEYRREYIAYVFSDVKKWENPYTFDIIIDDGSHFLEDVLWAAKYYFPKLRDGGIMVIEDVQNAGEWMHAITQALPEAEIETFDLRDVNGNYDDFLIVLKK